LSAGQLMMPSGTAARRNTVRLAAAAAPQSLPPSRENDPAWASIVMLSK